MRIIGKKLSIIILVLLIPYIYILYICIARTDQEAILTGGLTNVSSFVDIDSDYKEEGSFSSIYVTTYYPTTIFQNYILHTSTVNTVVDNSSSSHLSNEELSAMGLISHDASVSYSLMNAYNKAHEIDDNVVLSYSFEGIRIYYYNSDLDFKVNDLIVEINGISYQDEENYKNAFSNQEEGYVFKVLRNNKYIDITLDSKYFAGKGYVRYQFYSMYDINEEESYPKINVSSSGTGGPSGGLLQTLSAFNQLTEFDYSLGLNISGTGTISINGSVGPIGGARQKIFTAYQNNVDIFFCPVDNYEEAYQAWCELKHKERMKLVVVSTFEEAISFLENYE